MQNNGSKTRMLAYTALIAAVYAVLTVGVAPLSYGMIQIRFSEILVLLAFVDKRYAPADFRLFHCKLLQSAGHGRSNLRYLLYSSGTLRHHPFQQKLVYRKPLACILQCFSGRGILFAAKRTTVLDSGHHCAG